MRRHMDACWFSPPTSRTHSSKPDKKSTRRDGPLPHCHCNHCISNDKSCFSKKWPWWLNAQLDYPLMHIAVTTPPTTYHTAYIWPLDRLITASGCQSELVIM